jgi:hypothetical protein
MAIALLAILLIIASNRLGRSGLASCFRLSHAMSSALDTVEVSMKEGRGDRILQTKGFFNASGWCTSDTSIWGRFDARVCAQLLRSISMKRRIPYAEFGSPDIDQEYRQQRRRRPVYHTQSVGVRLRGSYLLSERFGHVRPSTASPRLGESGNCLSPRHFPENAPLRSDVVRFASVVYEWRSPAYLLGCCSPCPRRTTTGRADSIMSRSYRESLSLPSSRVCPLLSMHGIDGRHEPSTQNAFFRLTITDHLSR